MNLSKALYDRSVLRHDLRYFLMVLPGADEEYRELFLELVNDFLDRADPSAFHQGFAIDRLKWQLVRRRAMPELLDVLRFEADELPERAPLRRGRRWYGDYPYRHDERLALPGDVYRLGDELGPIARVENMRWDGNTLRLVGYAYIDLLGAPEPGSQRVELTAVRSGFPPKRLRLRIEEVHRPDLTSATAQQLTSLDYAGFVAALDGSELRRGGEWRPGSWELHVSIEAQGVRKRTTRLDHAPLCPVPPAELAPADGIRVRAAVARGGELRIRIVRERPLVPAVRVEDAVVELEGELRGAARGPLSLQVGVAGEAPRSYPAHIDRSRRRPAFLARVPVAGLAGAASLELVNGARRIPLRLPELSLDAPRAAGPAFITGAETSADGGLRLSGRLGEQTELAQLVVAGLRTPQSVAVPLETEEEGRFSVLLSPGGIDGTKPLGEGTYELLLTPAGAPRTEASAPRGDPALLQQLPISGTADRKRVHLGSWQQGPLVLAVERNLDDGERGGLAQRRLRTTDYPSARRGELREAVLYESFGGRECSDSPRAVYEELVRREAPLEHLWVVDDGAFVAPEGSKAIRKGSREYYDAYARARYLVANDHWPRWFRRREDQVAVQTWHGAPLKFQGRELAERPPAFREHRRSVGMGEGWDRVVSPGPFASPILERGYAIVGDVLETGLPRTDLLLGAAADERRAEIRRRLGLGNERVVLYAPTYRDDLDYALGHRPRVLRDEPTYRSDLAHLDGYRFWEPLDLEALAAGLRAGHALLFYKHPRVADATPPALAAAARDVSSYPDGLELLLAADVLVTDYSSWLFDFAATGRPVVLFAPDLEAYRDEVRGLHVDLETDGPGPVARTTDEVLAALASPEAAGGRREAFVKRYCPLSDGRASGRLVERVFEW
jgi:CDP-glycerol glycerophosphotransferase